MDVTDGTISCPYCAESIGERALICRHCHQNVALAISLMSRVVDLERELAIALTTLDAVRAEENDTVHEKRPDSQLIFVPGLRHFVWLAVANTCAYAVFAAWIDFGKPPMVIGIGLLFFPFFSGAWLGTLSGHVHLRKHLAVGAVVIVLSIGPFVVRDLITGRFRFPGDLGIAMALVFVPGLLAAAGGLMGRWVARFRVARPQQDTATRIADRLLRVRPNTPARGRKWVPALAGLIAAIAPILTFLAAVIGAYFTYLAAVAGKSVGK